MGSVGNDNRIDLYGMAARQWPKVGAKRKPLSMAEGGGKKKAASCGLRRIYMRLYCTALNI